MKIEIYYCQNNKNKQEMIPSMVNIKVNDESDYKTIEKLIKKEDIIEKRIKRKDKLIKNRHYYINVALIVDNVEYIKEGTETIHITGKITSSDCEIIKEGTKQSIWITEGCEFRLIKREWDQKELKIIDELINFDESESNRKKIASPKDLQEKCFDILHKYIVKDFNHVIYGNETLNALENGAIKVLFVTEEYIEKQSDNIKYSLSADDHKYHGANIVVYDKDSVYWTELSNYGGIIGVLKYDVSQIDD